MPATVPAIDVAICSEWSEQDINLYNRLPFYLVKQQIEYRKTWQIYSGLITNIDWKPNMGSTMRGVRKDPSPHLRQFAFPSEISETPTKDILDVREVTRDAVVRRHRFESQYMSFVPSFRDFMTDHVQAQSDDINDKITRYNDIFIRGHMFHQSPYVFLPNRAAGSLVSAPRGDGNAAGTDGKTTVFLAGINAEIGQPGNLSLSAIQLALSIMENDLRIPPFRQGAAPPSDDDTPDDKYVLILPTEAWNDFINDPWLQANKSIDLNIVTKGFKGNLFGRVVCKLEDLPLRFKPDGNFAAPETRELNPAAYNVGETLPNTPYSSLDANTGSPFCVAFLVGAKSYKSIRVGAPPSDFAGRGMPNGFGKMHWNGEVMITKNILEPCEDADGNIIYDTNKYGEHLQMIAQSTMGIIGLQIRNVLPIIYRRRRGA